MATARFAVRLRTQAARCALVAAAVAVAVSVLPSAARAERRFCGTAAGGDVLVEGPIGCAQAKGVMRRSTQLPPRDNGPGSPSGWNCFRITGGPPDGISCERGRVGLSLVTAPTGRPDRRRTCSPTLLYERFGVAKARTRGIPCWTAENDVAYWRSDSSPNASGPPGFRCRRSYRTDAGLPVTLFRCARGKRGLSFTLAAG